MNNHRREFPVGKVCKVFKLSRSSFYDWCRLRPSNRDRENRMILIEIQRIHQRCRASYGSPRMTEELLARGFRVSRPRVARLMKNNGIRAVRKKRFVVTTDATHNYATAPNRLARKFMATSKGQVWVSDITYIRTGRGWLYLTVIIDLFDRKVIGWALSSSLKAKHTSIAAWNMAVERRPPNGKLIFHSDRGIQYACREFTELLNCYAKVERSMSRKGNCWDNAVAESFFKSLKVENVYQKRYKTRAQAARDIFEWIETWYNRKRRHKAIGNRTIAELELISNLKNVA